MSDPVSLAGTALGVVSLGLILCQGLTDYLQALECRKADIESTSRQVDCLQSALNVINVALAKFSPDHQNAGHVVEGCLHLCEEEIKRLSDKLNEFKDQSHFNSFNKKLQLQAQKLAYPFKQGNLRRLEDSVVKINRILLTALQAMGLDVNSTQLEKLSLIATKSETTAHNVSSVMDSVSTLNMDLQSVKSMLSTTDDRTVYLSSIIEQSVPKIRNEISTTIPHIRSTLPKIELGVNNVASASSNMNQTLTVMSQGIRRVEANLNVSREMQVTGMGDVQKLLSSLHQSQSQQLALMGNLEREIRGQRLPLRPSLESLQDTSYNIDWPQFAISSNVFGKKHKRRPFSLQTGTKDFKSSICTCSGSYAFKEHRYLSRAVSLLYSTERYETHLPQCPFFASSQRIRKLTARFYPASYLLSTAILATISIQTGASGFSIAPYLSFKAVVPSNSPAFALFSKDNYADNMMPGEVLDSVWPKLLRLFTERRASVTDVNEFGQSLLHAHWLLSSINPSSITYPITAFYSSTTSEPSC